MKTRNSLVISAVAFSTFLTGCSGNRVPEAGGSIGATSTPSSKHRYIKQVQQTTIRVRPAIAVAAPIEKNSQARPVSTHRTAPSVTIRKADWRPPQPSAKPRAKHSLERQNQQNWARIHNGFQLPGYTRNGKVQRFIRSFSRNPEGLSLMAHRASPHLPYIVEQVQRRGMPMEIAMLPFVESAFKTHAYSHAHAAGLWQFIPSTGRRYGLKQTRGYDARYNPKLATDAALNYLQDLNREFKGDWLLSLAAYNCGEKRVHREIARNRSKGKPTSYWHLRLPKETRQYVPRLLAYKALYSNPERYGIQMPWGAGSMLAYTSPAAKPRTVAMNEQDFAQINRAFMKSKPHVSKSKKRTHRSATRKKIIHHRVRSGDTLAAIARKYGTSVRQIMRTNGMRSSKIIPGKRLKIVKRTKLRKRIFS